jgi:hypothetical protein
MTIKYHKTVKNSVIAELTDNNFIINETQDALELMGNLTSPDCTGIIIPERNFHKDFFNLKSGLAGDVLQKFSNYRIKLAITGDFSKYKSKSLQDFIRESNKGNMIYFLDSVESALMKLEKK